MLFCLCCWSRRFVEATVFPVSQRRFWGWGGSGAVGGVQALDVKNTHGCSVFGSVLLLCSAPPFLAMKLPLAGQRQA